jgi:hypothetical protein
MICGPLGIPRITLPLGGLVAGQGADSWGNGPNISANGHDARASLWRSAYPVGMPAPAAAAAARRRDGQPSGYQNRSRCRTRPIPGIAPVTLGGRYDSPRCQGDLTIGFGAQRVSQLASVRDRGTYARLGAQRRDACPP